MSLNQANVQPQYEEFEPPFDWDHDEGSHTLILALPGFRKEQLRVQITSTRMLRLSGERKISENKLRRFYRELPIPPDTDTGGISAKFEGGILYVRLPKVITTIEPKPPTTTTPTQLETPEPQQQPKPEAPNAQDQQKPREDKAAEPKTEKTEPPTQEYKDSQKKQEKEKGKAEEKDAKKVAKDERAEATISRDKEKHGMGKGDAKMGKRPPTLEPASRQTQEYKNAVYGLVEEIKKQRKLANLVVVIFLVLLLVLYVKNAIKSYFGGTKSQEL